MSERILLVDDEEEFLDIMSERMRNRGMEVVTASSAKEALEKIENDLFDAIILDLMMPDMNGLETIKAIKEKKPELQVILLSGQATLEKGIEAMKLGALDVVEKPADMETLVEKIKKAESKRALIVDKQTQENVKEMLKRYGM
ncbi:MAG: response regulator [Thermodesulfobacteriota bacterium]|nr:response regulator [Thermodesulfobacteriota bacterium]